MAKLTFTSQEVQKMKDSVASGHKSWNEQSLKPLKDRIKAHNLIKQMNNCCYCSKELTGEFAMLIDIEHILPKSKFLKHMFSSKNLSISCKRCNMNIKKDDLSFLAVPKAHLPKRVFRSRFYKFIHPNLDNFDEHLLYKVERLGRKRLIKYLIINNSNKGAFNYQYFKLDKLELNTFDDAQNATERVEISDPNLNSEFENLLHRYNQN